MESYRLDIEAELFASQIRDALNPVMDVENWIGAEKPSKNFAKGINVTGDDKELVKALVAAFRKVGLLNISTLELTPDPGVLLLETAGSPPRLEKKETDAVVLIGVKPIAS